MFFFKVSIFILKLNFYMNKKSLKNIEKKTNIKFFSNNFKKNTYNKPLFITKKCGILSNKILKNKLTKTKFFIFSSSIYKGNYLIFFNTKKKKEKEKTMTIKEGGGRDQNTIFKNSLVESNNKKATTNYLTSHRFQVFKRIYNINNFH